MKKKLIYMTVFGREDFRFLAALLVFSIRDGTDLAKVDLLVYCDARFGAFLKDFAATAEIPLRVVEKAESQPHTIWASWRRYDIFEVVDLTPYDAVLYLDTDIMVSGDLNIVFDRLAASPDHPLVAFNEYGTLLRYRPGQPWWGYDLFVQAGLYESCQESRVFTTAVLCFRPDAAMRELFAAAYRRYEDFRASGNISHDFYHCDQPYLNFLAITAGLVNAEAINDLVVNNPDPAIPDPPLICHFAGGIGHVDKLDKMLRFVLAHPALGAGARGYAMALSELRAAERRKAATPPPPPNLHLARRELDRQIYDFLSGRHGPGVRHGPFAAAGLAYPMKEAGAADLVLKWLGLFESCLHPAILSIAERRRGAAVVDLGAGEGYYAAGMGRLLGAPRIVAFEGNQRLHAACEELVRLNCPQAAFVQAGRATTFALQEILAAQDAVMFVDIEGEEELVLNPGLVPALARTEMVVECHEATRELRDIVARLVARFQDTHEVSVIEERDLAPSEVPELRTLRGMHRSLLACEARPMLGRWLHLRPRLAA